MPDRIPVFVLGLVTGQRGQHGIELDAGLGLGDLGEQLAGFVEASEAVREQRAGRQRARGVSRRELPGKLGVAFAVAARVLGGEDRDFRVDVAIGQQIGDPLQARQRCIDLAVPYAMEREAFGQKIGEFQMIQKKVADMVCRTESARALVYRLGRMKDAGVQRASLESSLAKLTASEAATQNALDAIQIHGGYGLSAEYEVGRLLLEAKALEFGEGTSELHRKLIAEFALGIRKQ